MIEMFRLKLCKLIVEMSTSSIIISPYAKSINRKRATPKVDLPARENKLLLAVGRDSG